MQMFQRNQGVQTPAGQLSEGTGEPNTVAHAVPMQLFALQYCDEHGKVHDTIAYKAGSIVYMDMNAERWASGLRQASAYIRDAVLSSAAQEDDSAPVPQNDDVDIVSDETADAQDSSAV